MEKYDFEKVKGADGVGLYMVVFANGLPVAFLDYVDTNRLITAWEKKTPG